MIRKALRKIVLGDVGLPQECTIGMPDPQTEVSIWLHGSGDPVDVTNNHVVACASPFTIGIGLGMEGTPLLRFRERGGHERMLAELQLRSSGTLSASGQTLSLFEVTSCRNYCLTRTLLGAYELHQAFLHWRQGGNPEIRLSRLAARAMNVFFICPRPVVLVSVIHAEAGNIFPMNLLGSIGNGYFAFALNSLRKPAPLVERAGQVALSTVPHDKAGLARQLGKNHRKESGDWDQVPLATRPSIALRLPVPQFALRVREIEVEASRRIGSHTLFLGRLIHDERCGEDLLFCMIHGIYQAWRLRAAPGKL